MQRKKTGSNWVDNGDGMYTGAYVATNADVNLQVGLNLIGWSESKKSENCIISPDLSTAHIIDYRWINSND